MTGAQESVAEAGNVGASDLAEPELAEAAAAVAVVNAEWTEPGHEPDAAAVGVAETVLTAAAEVGTDATGKRSNQINHSCAACSAPKYIQLKFKILKSLSVCPIFRVLIMNMKNSPPCKYRTL